MKINTLALALTAAILGAIYMLVIDLYPLISGKIFSGNIYGGSLRFIMKDMYPFYKNTHGFTGILLGMIIGFIDWFICGLVFGSLYNFISSKIKK